MSKIVIMPITLSIALAILTTSVAEAYETYPRERYDVILEKSPFGALPPGFVEPGANGSIADGDLKVEIIAPEEVVVAQEELSGRIRMQCVNIAPCGDVMVGFFDEADNSARYYLAVGDNHRGFSILDADYDREWAQIVKDGIMVTMKLGEGKIDPPEGSAGESFVFTNVVASTSTAGTPQISNPFVSAPNALQRRNAAMPKAAAANDEPKQKSSSFVERLRQRENERRRAAKKGEEEQKRKLLEMVRAATKEEIEKQKLEEAEELAEEEHLAE